MFKQINKTDLKLVFYLILLLSDSSLADPTRCTFPRSNVGPLIKHYLQKYDMVKVQPGGEGSS